MVGTYIFLNFLFAGVMYYLLVKNSIISISSSATIIGADS